MDRVGAVLIRLGEERRFVPASVAVRVAPTPPVTPVPGSPPELVGVVLFEGVVVPVLSIGPARGQMVVCTLDGELLAVVGGEAFETGLFEPEGDSPDVLLHDGRRFVALDVHALCSSVDGAARREPWAG